MGENQSKQQFQEPNLIIVFFSQLASGHHILAHTSIYKGPRYVAKTQTNLTMYPTLGFEGLK